MEIETCYFDINTSGNADIIDITDKIQSQINSAGFIEGNVLVFIGGSTAGITTIEYEPGLLRDYPGFFEKIIPSDVSYQHDRTWHDGNGHSHIRAALQGASFTAPFTNGKLLFRLQEKNKMKLYFKIEFFLFVVLLPIGFIYSWGEKGHEVINKKAVELLPKEMDSFKIWKDYLAQHASDADIRRKTDNTEAPRHYIDIDYYKEFLNGNMIENKDKLISKYGDSLVTANGILPWATLETLNNLTESFKEKNRDKILIYAADLGHYVADGHQPMHTTVNYNGQLSGQKGVHFRYEVTMVDKHIDALEQLTDSSNVNYVKNSLEFIFNYIANANSVNDVLLNADKLAHEETGSTESDDYYRIFWFRSGYVTKMQFKAAEEDLASLLYTAWINAGKPLFADIN